jgi:hypothetical protein
LSTANTITVTRDSGVWRATLGESPEKGVSSAAADPFDAIERTVAKAREARYAFDNPDAPPAPAPTPAPSPAPAPAEHSADAPHA